MNGSCIGYIQEVTVSGDVWRSQFMYSLGGAFDASPPKNRPERIGKGLKCMFIAQFFRPGQLIEKKIRPISLILWCQGGLKKMSKKGSKR